MHQRRYACTLLVLVISVLLSLFFFVISIMLAVNQAIPPFLFLLAVAFCFAALSKHYCKCLVYFKQGEELVQAKRKSLSTANRIVMIMAMITGISMTLVLLYSFFALGIRMVFQVYFLVVDVVSILYFANAVWIDKWLHPSARNAG